MKNEKITDVLNSLVEINNDRIEGYRYAAEETDNSDLKVLFNEMVTKSQMLNMQLANEVIKHGSKPTESTTTLGKVFRAWMDFKAAVADKDSKAILDSCVFGEDAAQETYEDAIKNNSELPFYIIQLITDQKAQLREDRNRIKSLAQLQ